MRGRSRMNRSDFKVMFVHINDRMRTVIPLNIAYLSASLKNAGFSTCLFDTSFYVEQKRIYEEKKKEDAGFFKAVDYSSIGVTMKNGSIVEDLLAKIEEEKPRLVAFSIFSALKESNISLAKEVKAKHKDISIVFGGVHVNIDPHDILKNDYVDFLCIGEGEGAIVDLAQSLLKGEGVEGVRNIAWKKGDEIVFNPCRAPVDMDDLPFMDWDLFDAYHIYGPYRGKLLRMALVEYSRTCPYKCTYCGNRIFHDYYKESGFNLRYRHKSPRRWIDELKYMKDNYNIEFVNIVDGTFVAQKEEVLEELAPLYKKEIDLPFFCDATVYCVSQRKLELLKSMGCECLNMGVECADEEYRKKYLDRSMTNEKIKEAFLMSRETGIDTRAYCIIGLPFETREQIMQTIKLLRECQVGSVSLNIFIPYEGTKLREVCIKEKLFDPIKQDKEIAEGDGTAPIIANSNLSKEELLKIYNSFILYVMAPEEVYPVVKLAEENTPFAQQLRKELMNIYT